MMQAAHDLVAETLKEGGLNALAVNAEVVGAEAVMQIMLGWLAERVEALEAAAEAGEGGK